MRARTQDYAKRYNYYKDILAMIERAKDYAESYNYRSRLPERAGALDYASRMRSGYQNNLDMNAVRKRN